MVDINPSTPPPIGSSGPVGAAHFNTPNTTGVEIQQIPTTINLQQPVDDEMTGLLAAFRFRNIDEMKKKPEEKEKGRVKGKGEVGEEISEELIEKIEEPGQVEEEAERLAKKNDEFISSDLVKLHNSIKPEDTSDEILQKVLKLYADPMLADEVLQFLGQLQRGELQRKVKEAQKKLNETKKQAILAGKNTQVQVSNYAPKLSKPRSALRDLYREILSKERTPNQLFDDFFQHFPFEHLIFVFAFIFDALGSDLNAAGPSASRAHLHKLMKDVKNVQAILGVYRYFKGSLRSIKNEFKRLGLKLPENFDHFFETLSKSYLKLIDKKYLSPNDLNQMVTTMGLSVPNAQKTILTNMREATRHTSLELYGNSNQRRQDVLNIFMNVLETMEKPKKEEKA